MGDPDPPPRSGAELLERYARGERHFAVREGDRLVRGVELQGAVLTGATLGGANLREAMLREADLRGADLSDVSLEQADLRGADLSGAVLQNANLEGACLTGANFRGARLRHAFFGNTFFDRADLGEADLEYARLPDADLRSANLRGARLRRASLRLADLGEAILDDADLCDADLRSVRLVDARLDRAVLRGAYLKEAVLLRTALRGADLHGVNLESARLVGADLQDADLGSALLDSTQLLDTNVAAFCEAEPPLQHSGPTTVDFRTIVKSLASPRLKDFLQRTGMPEIFVEYLVDCARSLTSEISSMLRSTFISYGGPDEAFARRLYEDLHRAGVTTFFFPEHAVPGEKLHHVMRNGVNEHDRVILICSERSLGRRGVLNEIEETLAREARDGGATYLVPIALDDFVFAGWSPDRPGLAQAIRDRVVADFRGAEADDARYNSGLLRLVSALRMPGRSGVR
jgi:uncharacterized protein YjbI with pentapeptide repeats